MAKLGEGLKFKYEPIWPQAPLDTKFHYYEEQPDGARLLKIHEDNFELITSLIDLESYVEKCKGKIIAFDTETTGLTYGEDKIVGFSLSLDRWSGFYAPIRHQIKQEIVEEVKQLSSDGKPIYLKSGKLKMKKVTSYIVKECEDNLDPKKALDIIYKILIGAKVVLMHNSEFDLNMLKFEGYDVSKIKSFDTLILPYLYDPEATKLAGLKALEKRVLGRIVPEFKDVLGKKNENFAFVDPWDGYHYACYDKETEVLTENGWVKWTEYNGISKLATVNLNTGELEYQSPTKLYKYRYTGTMECAVSKSSDYCVTPNHNMVVAQGQGKHSSNWLFKRADSLNAEEVGMKGPSLFKGTLSKIKINENEYDMSIMSKLAALILADGYCRSRKNTRRGYGVDLTTNFEKNYEEIVSILMDSPFKWNRYSSKSSKKVTHWECNNKDLWEWLAPYAGHGAINKSVPKEIFNTTKENIESFLRCYAITDGHIYATGNTQYYSISKKIIDDIQMLLMLCGKRSSISIIKPKKDRYIKDHLVKAENCHELYYLKVPSAKTINFKKYQRFQKDYDDFVYCAEVPNHTLITRRNGKTLVAGNCFDTAGTYGIYEEMFPKVKELLAMYPDKLVFNGKPYNVLQKDNQMVKMFVDYYGHAKILIDREKAIKYKEQLEKERDQVVSEIYKFFDRGIFNLSTSSKEFKEVMGSKNVYTRVKTEKGGDSWGKKAAAEMKKNIAKLRECLRNWKKYSFVLSKLSKDKDGYTLANLLLLYGTQHFQMIPTINDLKIKNMQGKAIDYKEFWKTIKKICEEEEQKIHILALIQRNNSLNKALNSYVDKLTQVDECFMRYRLKGTKSGRLSSGNGSKSDKKRNHYYIDLNAQNLTKPASGYYVAEKCPMEDEESILGWKFKPVEKDYAMEHLEDLYIVEGQDPGITIRGCLKAPEGEIKTGYISDETGEEEQELFAVELEDGRVLECNKDAVFKTNCNGKIGYLSLEQIMSCKGDVEII